MMQAQWPGQRVEEDPAVQWPGQPVATAPVQSSRPATRAAPRPQAAPQAYATPEADDATLYEPSSAPEVFPDLYESWANAPQSADGRRGFAIVGDPIQSDETGAYDAAGLTPEQLSEFRRGDRLALPSGQRVTLGGRPFYDATRASDVADGGFRLREPNATDTTGAFAMAAGEQLPFLDEAAVAANAALSGKSYSDARGDYSLAKTLLNESNRPARIAGGIGGAALGLAAPGGGWVQGATGAARVGRAAALSAGYGGVYGAGAAEGGLPERAEGAAWGAGLGGATGGFLQLGGDFLGRSAARARANPSPQRTLSQQGVELTPGQMAGGAFQRIEDGLTSFPGLGDSIRNAQRRGLESFNVAAVNQALEPIGQRLPARTMGREAVRVADDMVGTAYDGALQGVTVDPAQGFAQGVAAARSQPLPARYQDGVTGLVDDFERRFSQPLSGSDFKQLESELNAAIRSAQNGAGMDPGQRLVADRLVTLKQGLSDSFNAADPFAGADKALADASYARLVRIRDASQAQGTAARDGLFTPSDLNRAVRNGDSSAGNRQYARGEALGQDLTDAAMRVLPRTVPDSGTPLRTMLAAGGIGGGAVATGANAGPVLGAAAALGTGMGFYSQPVQGLLNRAYRAKTAGAARAALADLQLEAARNPALGPTVERLRLTLLPEQADAPRPPRGGLFGRR